MPRPPSERRPRPACRIARVESFSAQLGVATRENPCRSALAVADRWGFPQLLCAAPAGTLRATKLLRMFGLGRLPLEEGIWVSARRGSGPA